MQRLEAAGVRARACFASIDNLLDEEYETFGLFGEPDAVLGDEFDEPYFVGPRRAAWIRFRIEL